MTPAIESPSDPAPFDDYLPTVSGAPGSALDAAALDFEGRRFLGSALTGLGQDPIRVYAGAAHGGPAERAELLADELVRLGAGERTQLVLAAPTGRGWANHVMLRALEAFTDGDVATACAQFGTERSSKSSALLPVAAESMRALIAAVRERPELASCQLLLVGESFGAWTLVQLLKELAVEPPAGMLLAATPGVARLDARATTAALWRLEAAGMRLVRLERAHDPVVAIPGASLAWRPSRRWRRADARPWLPGITARRALQRIDHVTRFDEPWRIDLTVHDYRRDLPRAAAQLLGMSVTRDADRITAVTTQLLELEQTASTWLRSYGPQPQAVWPGAGV